MGFVIVISVPLILLVLIIVIAAYLLGRARGRSVPTQYYGPPAPPFAGPPPPDQGK
ncbi:hypothetical protein BVRB_7g161870 [Beta vulgaris subsp. vulgaris]|nr:hypothetical protein BVRB_7g161870 [Beta vulgaris subsp. vulgaris]